MGPLWTQQITWSAFRTSLQPDWQNDNAFLTGQSWCMLKSWDTVGVPEQGFQSCFADGHNRKLSSICGASHPRRNPDSTSGGGAIPTSTPTQTQECLSIISIAVSDFSILFKFSGEHYFRLTFTVASLLHVTRVVPQERDQSRPWILDKWAVMYTTGVLPFC